MIVFRCWESIKLTRWPAIIFSARWNFEVPKLQFNNFGYFTQIWSFLPGNLKLIAEYFQRSETFSEATRDWIGIYEECAT